MFNEGDSLMAALMLAVIEGEDWYRYVTGAAIGVCVGLWLYVGWRLLHG